MATQLRAFTRRLAMNETVDCSTGHSFSLMTYNILNDTAIRDGYKYCPEEIRYMPHRSKHIIEEINDYNPGIICMQEVRPDVYAKYLEDPLEELGYKGVYQHQEEGSKFLQGDAVFYKKKTFTLVASKVYRIGTLAEKEIEEYEADTERAKDLAEHMQLPQQVILVRLQHEETKKYIHLASLHIYWGKLERPDIQAFQICAVIRCLEKFMVGIDDPVYIMAGDFNTPPHFPAYQMMEETAATPNEKSLELLKHSAYRRKDGKMEYMVDTIPQALGVNLKLVSSYKHVLGTEPNITNCDGQTTGEPWELCLDYIWFSPDTLEVAAVMETPPDEAVRRHGGLPSELFPSDHLPLMAEFKLK